MTHASTLLDLTAKKYSGRWKGVGIIIIIVIVIIIIINFICIALKKTEFTKCFNKNRPKNIPRI